jgi:sulfite dehydrogenase
VKLLAGIDRALAPATWLVAAVLALMLLVGPRVVADDSAPAPGKPGAQSYGGGSAAADGRALFTSNCGTCHTLAAAGTSGQVGPKLDGLKLEAASVESTMRSGSGVMPSFKGKLSDPEIAAVAAFVAKSSG